MKFDESTIAKEISQAECGKKFAFRLVSHWGTPHISELIMVANSDIVKDEWIAACNACIHNLKTNRENGEISTLEGKEKKFAALLATENANKPEMEATRSSLEIATLKESAVSKGDKDVAFEYNEDGSEKHIRKGYLTKLGHSFPFSWQSKYFFITVHESKKCLHHPMCHRCVIDREFTLYPSRLDYATSDGVLKGSFPLSTASVVHSVPPDEADNHSHAFKLITNGGTIAEQQLTMYASNSLLRDEWIQTFEHLFKVLRKAPVVDTKISDEQLKLEEELKKRKEAEEENAKKLALEAAAEEERIHRLKAIQLSKPIRCMKKLSTESQYSERYIWVTVDTGDFYWSKTPDVADGKFLHVRDYALAILSSTLPIDKPNFQILLDTSNLPPSMFTTSMKLIRAKASSIDIYFDTVVAYGSDPDVVRQADISMRDDIVLLLKRLKSNRLE